MNGNGALIGELEALRPSLIETDKAIIRPGPMFAIDSVAVQGNAALQQLGRCVAALHKAMPAEAANVSEDAIRDALVQAVWSNRSQPADRNTLADIKARLTEHPVEDWTVSRTLRGALLEMGEVVRLGPYTFWEYPKHQNQVNLPKAHVAESDALKSKDSPHVIVATVSGLRAADKERALEMADESFERLDNLLSYALSWTPTHYELGVFEFSGPEHLGSVVTSPTRISTGRETRGAMAKLSLDDPAFHGPELGLGQLWAIASNPKPAEMHRRLLTAAEWVGKSRRDPDHAKAFTQIVFALEAMLQFQEKGTLVSPGVAYRIAETCAYLIGIDREWRLKVAADVNEFYDARSKVVHGGSTSVSEGIRFQALQLVLTVLRKLLTDPELSKLNSAKALSDWVQQRKYARSTK